MQKKFDSQKAIKYQKQGQKNNNNALNNRHKTNDMRKMIQNYSFGLNDEIYKNNFCKIYTGININNQNNVAVKAVQLKTLNHDMHEQLQCEIKLVKSLPKHHHLVNVFDIFCTTNNCYFIMQLCQADLKSLLKKKKVLSQKQFYPILMNIIDALAFLQSNNYTHSNLKLSNILLSKECAKLSDFSKCQRINDEQDQFKLAKQWNPYMCPDTLLTKKFTSRNDIWAIGVITYECLHGYHMYPWKFSNFQQILQKIYENNIRFSPSISQKTVQFIQKCLNPKLDLRIQQLYEDRLIKQLKGLHNNEKNQISQTLNKEENRRVQDCINSEINFMRFLFLIYQFEQKVNPNQIKDIDNGNPKKTDYLYFKALLIKQILVQKQNLKLTFRKNHYNNQINPFNILGLNIFLQNFNNYQKIKNYFNIIQEYDAKYACLLKQFQSLGAYLNKQIKSSNIQWRSRDILTNDYKRTQTLPIFGIHLARDKCIHIWKQIQQNLQILNKQTKIQSVQKLIESIQSRALHLDFMISYYLINCLLIDDFLNSQKFSKQSCVSIILNNKPEKIQISLLWMIQKKMVETGFIQPKVLPIIP